MLIALDFHLRGIEPEPVAGFRTWLKLGRCVRKGEHGIRIAARVTPKKSDPGAEGPEREQIDGRDRRPVRFTTVAVFGLSQTDRFASCARRSQSCVARTRSSGRRRCFSLASSIQTVQSEPLYR
jgi:antirestriction protein ArdC